MGLVLVSRLAFADGLETADRFLFSEGESNSWDWSSAVVGPKLAIQNVDGEEASVSSGRGTWDMSVAQYSELKPKPKPKPKPSQTYLKFLTSDVPAKERQRLCATNCTDSGRKNSKPKPKPVPVLENWGVSDSLGFFALALLAFGVLILLRVLRPFRASTASV